MQILTGHPVPFLPSAISRACADMSEMQVACLMLSRPLAHDINFDISRGLPTEPRQLATRAGSLTGGLSFQAHAPGPKPSHSKGARRSCNMRRAAIDAETRTCSERLATHNSCRPFGFGLRAGKKPFTDNHPSGMEAFAPMQSHCHACCLASPFPQQRRMPSWARRSERQAVRV